MEISWLLCTNLQNKTLCCLLCTNLQNKTRYWRVIPFKRSEKSQHKYILSNSGWKLSLIINKTGEGVEKEYSRCKKNRKNNWRREGASIRQSGVGTNIRLKKTLLNFWIKLTQKGYFRNKKLEIIIKFYIFKLI